MSVSRRTYSGLTGDYYTVTRILDPRLQNSVIHVTVDAYRLTYTRDGNHYCHHRLRLRAGPKPIASLQSLQYHFVDFGTSVRPTQARWNYSCKDHSVPRRRDTLKTKRGIPIRRDNPRYRSQPSWGELSTQGIAGVNWNIRTSP